MFEVHFAPSKGPRLISLALLCLFTFLAAAAVLEKRDVSIGQLTVPEIEDKLQVRISGSD